MSEKEKSVVLTVEQQSALNLFSCWWAMVNAERELCEDPIKPDSVVLHYMGCGASCMVFAKDLTEIAKIGFDV